VLEEFAWPGPARYLIFERLGRFGSLAAEPLEQLLVRSEDRELRVFTAAALLSLGSRAGVDVLIDAVRAGDPLVCLAVRVLADSGISEAVPRIEQAVYQCQRGPLLGAPPRVSRDPAGAPRRAGGPVPVIAEAAWLILDRLGTAAQAAFLRLITAGQLAPADLTAGDWRRCTDLAEQPASLRLDLIDASLIAVAERYGLTTLATLNHRDFTVVRPRRTAAFTLLPG
jgi:predicted nucleic acid-binding protein